MVCMTLCLPNCCFAGFFGKSQSAVAEGSASKKKTPNRRRSVISIHRKAGQDDLLEAGRWIYRLVCTVDVEKVYTLQRQIGKGSFAKVYSAQHKEMGYHRAVKKIRKPKSGANKGDILNEIYALMDLDHPHIIRLSRMYDGEEFLYIVAELCNGPSLYERIAKGPLSEQEQGRALRHILKAVHCCHAHYMGHYDIKPENFMYSEPDLYCLKMIDLGLSSNFMQESGNFKGTCRYMAPEMFKGVYGPEADIWSCSVIMFEMAARSNMISSATPNAAVGKLVCTPKWISCKYDEMKSFGVSDNCLSLLRQMLRIDRHMRITALSALAHDYIVQTYTEDDAPSEDSEKALQVIRTMVPMFQNFASETVFTRAVLSLMVHIAGYITSETRAHRRAFAMLDRIGVGEISQEAIETALATHGLEVPEKLHEAFSAVALHNGYITYSDFLAATFPRSLRCREDLCRRTFTLLDHNHDGVITSDDLEHVFLSRDEQDNRSYIRLIRDALAEAAGTVHGPKLTFEDFQKLVLGGRKVILTSKRSMRSHSGF